MHGRAVARLLAVPAVALTALVLSLAAGAASGAGSSGATVTTARGTFVKQALPTSGSAILRQRGGGDRVVVLRNLQTTPAPDLFVHLVFGKRPDGTSTGRINLGPLKSVTGTHQYAVPDSADISKTAEIVIWCDLCALPWGKAPLRAV